ncbi:MAG: DUF885 domain-containing protein [Thermoanaerobaculia bacterium]|jgi:uncharacterized protein (DUF885 family)
MRYTLMLLVMMATGAQAGVVEGYLEAYFEMFPTRATAAGLHDLDHSLEDLSPTKISEWVGFNRSVAEDLKASLGNPELEFEDRLDAELLLREAELQLLDLDRLRRPQKDPLYWTGVVSQATVFLLVREDRPRHDRLAAVASRVEQIPRFAAQAQSGLAPTATDEIAPELCRLASRQAQASAQFYAEGLAAATTEDDDADLRQRLGRAGEKAATALTQLAAFLDELGKKATGSPRLGEDYRARFEIVNGMTTPLAEVLDGANEDLAAKLREAAEYGRSVWEEVMGDEDLPASDKQVVAALFQRVSDDRASTTDEFIADYRQLVDESVAFVRQKQIITLPEPLTLFVGRSPDFFIGQSVGGVYPAGPFAADDAKTLLFLPTPPADATQEELEGFFRDFNHHFNVMITPHELIPGHYLQLKWAARHPRKVRALFGDGVYIEGWGTFSERLMLDVGWGGALDRLAHLKKQLENIARTIVDIRVHTQGMSREEVLRLVREEALQDEQFAENMWWRALTSAPQLTSYHLGYRQVHDLYEEVRTLRGEEFRLQEFMDGMMTLGPVPVKYYRDRFLQGTPPG